MLILDSEVSNHKPDVYNEAPVQDSRSEGSIDVLSLLSVGLVYYYMHHVCFLYDICVFVCIY